MSIWTHVAAVFRYDGIDDEFMRDGEPDWDMVFGRCTEELDPYGDYSDEEVQAWIESTQYAYGHRDEYTPLGSEGSLQRTVWENTNKSRAARYVVNVFGDLRDFDDVNEVHRWFERSCLGGSLRQGVCHVSVDGYRNETWSHDFMLSDRLFNETVIGEEE